MITANWMPLFGSPRQVQAISGLSCSCLTNGAENIDIARVLDLNIFDSDYFDSFSRQCNQFPSNDTIYQLQKASARENIKGSFRHSVFFFEKIFPQRPRNMCYSDTPE